MQGCHSQKLRQKVTEEELDRDYRNEGALTIALMGLMAEEESDCTTARETWPKESYCANHN